MGKLGFDNDHEFTLDSTEMEAIVLENDPLNWETDDKSYTYDKLGGGTLAKVNTNLEFTDDGFDFIRMHSFGSEITVTKRMKDPTKIGEDWRISYLAGLDLTKAKYDYSKTKPIAKVPFNQGGLYDKIKARYNDKYDLVDTKDADGNDIGPLKTIIEQVLGRELERRSEGEVLDGVFIEHPVTGADKDNAHAVPFAIKINSDQGYINSVVVGSESVPFASGDYAIGQIGSIMFPQSDRTRKRKLNGKVKIKIVDTDIGFIRLEKVFYKYNTSTNVFDYWKKSSPLVSSTNPTLNSFVEHDFVDDEVELNENEAMALVWYSNTDDGIHYEYYDTKITITEDDKFKQTIAKDLLPFELIDRLLTKITGESGLLVSNLFGRKDLGYKDDGLWSLLAVSSGYWARGFDLGAVLVDPETGEDVPPKQFTISLKEAFESYGVTDPNMWGIIKIKGKEVFKLEEYAYTRQDFTGIQLGREIAGKSQHIPANKPIETTLTKNLYTKVEIGYQEGGKDFEEISGLHSPHGKGEYNTSLKTEPNTYTKVSKIRADVEGYDLGRRKQSVNFPDTDTSYDQKLFFRHLKKVGDQYFMRTWQDDFEVKPKNVYSPDTTGNLLLTPFRCLRRHGPIISTGLHKNPYGKLVAISSEANNNKLITKIAGEAQLAENGFIQNIDLGTPYINGFLLSFEGKVYQSMIDQFEGYTEINGERIPNWCGKFEVMRNGVLQYGRLDKSNITKEGKHQIALI